jgi:hypothetical protein
MTTEQNVYHNCNLLQTDLEEAEDELIKINTQLEMFINDFKEQES